MEIRDPSLSVWERYVQDAAAETTDDAAREQVDANNEANAAHPALPTRGTAGFEFRPGRKTEFPEISLQEGEGEEAAAFRVAADCRVTGLAAFADPDTPVWGAQHAVDHWGKGILALIRLRNLRQRRQPEQEEAAQSPSDDAVDSLEIVLRLNMAQALLKLQQFEGCVAHCDAALKLQPSSCKALWRKAKAVWGLRNPGLAREALGLLLGLEPGNAAARALLKEIDANETKRQQKRVGPQLSKASQPQAAEPSEPSRSSQISEQEARKGDTRIKELRGSWLGCCRHRKME